MIQVFEVGNMATTIYRMDRGNASTGNRGTVKIQKGDKHTEDRDKPEGYPGEDRRAGAPAVWI